MVLAISPPLMPPARGRGRPLARRYIVLIFRPDPIRPARRAAQPCSPALAPLSAARSRAPGRHVGDMPPAFTRERIKTMARTSKKTKTATVPVADQTETSSSPANVEAAVIPTSGTEVFIPLDKL